jgi:hypothetical protein
VNRCEDMGLSVVGMMIERCCCDDNGDVVEMMIVGDDSASLVKDLGLVLSFRRARMESSVVFERST